MGIPHAAGAGAHAAGRGASRAGQPTGLGSLGLTDQPGQGECFDRSQGRRDVVLFDVEAFDPLGAENRGKAREERALLVAEMGLGDRSKRPGEDQHPIGIAVVTGLLELLEERQHFAVLGVRDGLELLD